MPFVCLGGLLFILFMLGDCIFHVWGALGLALYLAIPTALFGGLWLANVLSPGARPTKKELAAMKSRSASATAADAQASSKRALVSSSASAAVQPAIGGSLPELTEDEVDHELDRLANPDKTAIAAVVAVWLKELRTDRQGIESSSRVRDRLIDDLWALTWGTAAQPAIERLLVKTHSSTAITWEEISQALLNVASDTRAIAELMACMSVSERARWFKD